jgi:hypothetical protein
VRDAPRSRLPGRRPLAALAAAAEWLFRRETLPDARETSPPRPAPGFVRWLLAREELPSPSGKASDRSATPFLRWLLSRDRLGPPTLPPRERGR